MKFPGKLSFRTTFVIWLALLGVVALGIACQPSETTTSEAVEPASGSMMAMEDMQDPGVSQDRVALRTIGGLHRPGTATGARHDAGHTGRLP